MYQNSESLRLEDILERKEVYLECYIKVAEYLSSEDIWGKRYEIVAVDLPSSILEQHTFLRVLDIYPS